jgi:hypothetical protein
MPAVRLAGKNIAMDYGESSLDIRSIVAAALTAPTADNCQPWAYVWEDSVLTIWHDDARGESALNPAGTASLLSLGCVLELIQLASTAQGHDIEFELRGLGARVRFNKRTAPADPLPASVFMRATDRRIYRRSVQPDQDFIDIATACAAVPGCELRVAPARPAGYPERYMRYVQRCEEYVWDCHESAQDFLSWLRLSRQEIARCNDGMPWPGIGVNWLEAQGLRTMRALPWAAGRMFATVAKRGAREIVGQQIRSSSGLIGIATNSLDDADLVAAGRTALRAWLSFNAAGYGVQPLTIHPHLCYLVDRRILPAERSEKWEPIVAEGKSGLQQTFGFSAGSHPVWVFRAGRSSPFPERMKTKRRKLEDCLVIGSTR